MSNKKERDAYNIYEALFIAITNGCHCLVPTYILLSTDVNQQGDGPSFVTVGRRIEDNLLRTVG
jgi:hypothetical protein